jgi:prepilin-type N-terminal cleavage/methylation domain-containing protein
MRVRCLPRTRPVRRGLTLIELVVVMLILAAVAGIVLPLLPKMVTRAHTSTSATNLTEVAKAIQTYESTYGNGAYPNNFDSLVTGSGSLATYIPGYTGADLTTITVTSGDSNVEALAEAGITSVSLMAGSGSGDFSPTFYPYGDTIAAITPTSSINSMTALAGITGTAAAREFNLPIGGTYVVFGLGGRTSMQGKTLQEAPVHFDDSPDGVPNLSYARLGVVFQTAGLNTSGTLAPFERARLVGIVGFHDDGIAGLNDHLKEYWAANSQ